MSPSFGVALLVVLAALPGHAYAAATTTTSETLARGSFAALSPADKDVARALYKAQTGSGILTLDEIAQLRRQGRGWDAVFKEMKSRRVISATSLGEVLKPARRQPVAVVIAEGTTLQRMERLLFESRNGIAGGRTSVHARFRDMRLTAADYGRLLRDIRQLRDLPQGSRVLLEGSIDGRDFSAELHRERNQLQVRTEGLGFRSREEAQTFVDSFAPEAPSRLRVRGMIDGYEVSPARGRETASAAPASPPPSTEAQLSGAAAVASASGYRATIMALASDPGGQGAGMGGFSRNHWISSRAKVLSVFGAGDQNGDTSGRLYDPVTNTWSYAWPADRAQSVHKRDNHGSLYVSALDEFWIWDGSYLNAWHYRSGRFSFARSGWVSRSSDFGGAFVGVVDMSATNGFITQGINGPACAWSEVLDMGMVGFGSRNGNPTDEVYLIERKPEGPERYRVVPFAGPRPPARTMVYGALVAAGTDFYLIGTQNAGVTSPVKDFWKFDGRARKWIRLADPPSVSWAPSLTYDSTLNLVVAWIGRQLFAYEIAAGRWVDITPSGLPALDLAMAVYAPSARLHVYEGGHRAGGVPFNGVVGIRIEAVGQGTPAAGSPGPPAPKPAESVLSSAPVPPTTVVGSAPAPARKSATNPPSLSPTQSSGRVQVPLKTWLKVPLPPGGQGPCTAPVGCKHVRPAVNIHDGRIYFFGGDYQDPPYPALFSYSIAGNDWRVEVPACGNTGDSLVPLFPDQVVWAYDSKRRNFHYAGGFFFNNPDKRPCASGVERRPWPLTFDPATRKWSVAPYPGLSGSGNKSQFGYYDAVTDSLLHLGTWNGNNGVLVLDLTSNTWSGWVQGRTTDGTYINEGDIAEDNQGALDAESRHLYVVNRGPGHSHTRLLRYNLDSRTVTNLGDTPQQTDLFIPLLAWDSVNKVLFWLTSREAQGSILWAYKPATRTWERIAMQTPDGVQARGNLLVFDPLQNALLLMGGVNWNNEPDPSFLKYLFLYRYGDGGN